MAENTPFPITAAVRRRLDPEGELFGADGGLAVAGIRGARLLALELNRETRGGRTTRAGAVHALGLLHRVMRSILRSYRDDADDSLTSLLRWLAKRLGVEPLDGALLAIAETYPPPEVFAGQVTAIDYLAGNTQGIPHRLLLLEELLLIWWINRNPALESLRTLFDDAPLEKTVYPEIASRLRQFFEDFASTHEEEAAWRAALEGPPIAAPESLRRQVENLANLPELMEHLQDDRPAAADLVRELLVAGDLLREEEKASFVGPGPVETPVFAELEGTPRRMAKDSPWMAGVVLGAKHVHVWMHQLGEQYGQAIARLDEIPRRALEQLVELGWTSLWLIGIWERSPASRMIKRLCGNPEAEASAYSLLDYRIADDLGGDRALKSLEAVAKEVGLHLATDMVPNHTGIDSRWVMQSPEYFLGLPDSPFPSYTFDGPNLSYDESVAIHLEDHYYDRSDAAVVFRREDRETGDVHFIYHGNDGTGLPWSDTAQLNYLNPEVREAVIEEIVAVAQRFPIVRFDAAMTLTQQHFHRLWYPAPGTGGDIPSRSEHGVEDSVFRALMPEEFWWDVAQRLQKEAPDTLLVAEAFWLLEGYFVRSLGIHRVYNSAFMHMLREENAGSLRRLLRGALLFDPAILSRFINFLSNPDEETARQQFGSGDKFFAAATLLATIPGTPMFAHGQIGGLSEKYGMEYRRPYRREKEDERLVARHLREIQPLLSVRPLFSGSKNFELFDFVGEDQSLEESVIAFSNGKGDERVLVICNYSEIPKRGRIGLAAPRGGDDKTEPSPSLATALGVAKKGGSLIELVEPRDSRSTVVDPSDLIEDGLALELGPFQSLVAILRAGDGTAITGTPGLVATLTQWAALASKSLEPPLDARQQAFRDVLVCQLDSDSFREAMGVLLEHLESAEASDAEPAPRSGDPGSRSLTEEIRESIARRQEAASDPAVVLLLASYDLLFALSRKFEPDSSSAASARWYLELWNLGPALVSAARFQGLSSILSQDLVSCLRALLSVQELDSDGQVFDPDWLHDPDVRDLLRIHDYDGKTFFLREGLERLLWARFLVLNGEHDAAGVSDLAELLLVVEQARWSDYQLDEFLREIDEAQ